MSSPSIPGSHRNGSNGLIMKVNFVMDLVSVKVIFLVHFLVMLFALSCYHWMPQIYLYYNTFFFALLFWAIHTKGRNIEPILIAAVVDLVSIALDVICIVANYEYAAHYRGWYPASLVFLILNTVLRPFTSFILARLYFSKNRTVLSIHQGGIEAGNGSSLTSAIRKVLFLSPEGRGVDRSHTVDPNGAYRTTTTTTTMTTLSSAASSHHQNIEKKNSANSLTAVLAVPSQSQQQQFVVPQPQPRRHSLAQQQSELEQQPKSQEQPQQPSQQATPETSQPEPLSEHHQSEYTDPSTGETFQERMI